MSDKVFKIIKSRAIYLVLLFLIILFTVLSEDGRFLSTRNIMLMIRQVAVLGIASVGMTYVLLIGGIDLSAGSTITMVNILAAYAMVKLGINPWIACIIGILFACSVGFINGFFIANLKIPPLIMTFATQIIIEGLAFILCGGLPIFGFPSEFLYLGQGFFLGIPVPIWIMALTFVLGIFILNRTYFGRYFYALGSNESATNLSGINVKKVKYAVYTLSGFFAGLGGLVLLSRTNSGQPTSGRGFEFDIITAVVLGGVSVNGGSGKLSNVIAGVLIIGVLGNGMILLDISSWYQMVIKGTILASAVGFDCIQQYGLLKRKHTK